MSFPPPFDLPSTDSSSKYHFVLHSSNSFEFKPLASRFDWVKYSDDANQAELATRYLFENPSSPAKGRYTPAKIFNEIFVKLVDNEELAPLKVEARVYDEAKSCFSKLQNKAVKCEEKGNDLYVYLKV